jgi:SAM-dependent methyltransferase
MNTNKPMYPERSLYRHYKERLIDHSASPAFPDFTKRVTLENMNHAMNLCESWDFFLDIGGGSGHYAAGLSAMFKKGEVIEVEDPPEHKELVGKYPNLGVTRDLIESYKGNQKADFILLADVFEHIRDIRPFVAQISALQDKDAVVYIMTPNPVFCGPVTESGLHHSRKQHGHIKHYTTGEICSIMAENGYELQFLIREEAPLRQTVKRWRSAASRRDVAWRGNVAYRFIRVPLITILTPIMFLAEKIVYSSEVRARDDQFRTMTQNLAFKKTK